MQYSDDQIRRLKYEQMDARFSILEELATLMQIERLLDDEFHRPVDDSGKRYKDIYSLRTRQLQQFRRELARSRNRGVSYIPLTFLVEMFDDDYVH